MYGSLPLTSDRVRISVVVPAMNEARNLPHVFAALPANLHEVILVDGNSADDTVSVAQALRPDVIVIRQTRRGKGNALACGFAVATGDIVVMIDADGSTDPAEIPNFVTALLRGADFAKGTRFGPGAGSSDITRLRRCGNKVLNVLVNGMYGTRFTDLCYGYNAFWTRCLPVLDLDPRSTPGEGPDGRRWGDGFEIETLINIRVAAAGLRIEEVPSFEHHRIHGVSNLSAVSDGLRVVRTILSERRQARSSTRPIVLPIAHQRSTPSPTVIDLTTGPAGKGHVVARELDRSLSAPSASKPAAG